MSPFLEALGAFLDEQPFEIIRLSEVYRDGAIETLERPPASFCQNVYSVANARKLTRSYDVSTLAIDRRGRDYVVVSLEAFDGGESAGRVQLRVNLEESGWRLDWPTY